MKHSLLLVVIIGTYPITIDNHLFYIGNKKNSFFSVIGKLLFVTKTMQHCDKILQKKLMRLNNRQYISAQILEDLTGTKFPQTRRLIGPHVNAAVINMSMPFDEIIFAQTGYIVKGKRKC